MKFIGARESLTSIDSLDFSSATILAEVALIRDAYYFRKPNVEAFMDKLVQLIKGQENVSDCRLFSQLPLELKDPKKTHPKQIRQKAKFLQVDLTPGEWSVYGALQGMFNAKPDLAILIDGFLIVFEAKFTEKFDEEQINRTKNITQIWASELLLKDLGFSTNPSYTVAKLGDSSMNVDLSWNEVLEVAKNFYSRRDRTLIALKNGVALLSNLRSNQ